MKKFISFMMSLIMSLTLFTSNVSATDFQEVTLNQLSNPVETTEEGGFDGPGFDDGEFDGPEFDYEDLKYGPDEAILVDLLNNRYFVIQTLTQDFITKNNPNLGYTQDYLYKGVLENYMDEPAFAAAVTIWDDYHNLGSAAMEIPSALADFFASEEDWANFIKGVESKKYEQVISKLLTSEYSSDSGLSTAQEQASTQYLRELYSSAKQVKDFYSDYKAVNGAISDVNSAFQIEFINDYFRNYKNDTFNYISFIQNTADNAYYQIELESDEEKKISGLELLQIVRTAQKKSTMADK